jgi:hypothetical protein
LGVQGTVSGDLALTSGEAITDSAALSVTGTTTVTTDVADKAINLGSLASTGTVTLSTLGTSGAATVVNANGLALAGTVNGDLSATATTGDISNPGSLTVTGASTLITAVDGSNVILDHAGNAFSGAVTLKADTTGTETFGNISFVDDSAVKLDADADTAGDLFIDASTDGNVGGNLLITATTGNITQGVALGVTGSSTLTTSASDATITLGSATNALGGNVILTTSGTAGHVTIENGTTALGVQGTVSGDLILTSGDAIIDSDVLTVTGTTTVTTDVADKAINLGSLASSGNVIVSTLGTTGDVTIDNSDTALGVQGTVSGDLILTSGEAITDSAELSVTGTTTVTTDVADKAINFGSFVSTGNVIVSTLGTTGNVTIDNGTTALGVQGTVSGDLVLTSGDTIYDSDSLTVTGTTTVTTDVADKAINLGSLASTGNVIVSTLGTTGNVTIDNGTTALGVQGTIGGDLVLTSGQAITDSGTLTASGSTTIDSGSADITLDEVASTFGTLSLTGANVAVTDAGATDLGASTVSGTLGITSGGAVTSSGKLDITGATTISASGQAVSLTNSDSTFGDFSVIAKDVYIVESGSFSSTSIAAETIQVSATEGVSVISTGDGLQLAAQSGTGNIDVVNTGGLVISELANLQGIQFTDDTASGKVSLVAKSPLTINAAIDAKAGEVLLVASGSDLTDDVTINSNVVGASVDVYAGDSIAVTSDATINSPSFELNVGTNYDIATASTSTGSSSAGLSLSNTAGLQKIKIPSIGLITGKGRITEFSSDGITFMDDYFNALNPVLEQSVKLDEIGITGSVESELYDFVETDNSGLIEIEKKK